MTTREVRNSSLFSISYFHCLRACEPEISLSLFLSLVVLTVKEQKFIKKAKQLTKFNRLLRHEGLEKGEDGKLKSTVDYSKYENDETEALKREDEEKKRRKRAADADSEDHGGKKKKLSLRELSHQVKRQKREE